MEEVSELKAVGRLLGIARPDASWQDERLVAACLAGDEAAWEALIDKYKRLIYAIPFHYGASATDADDIFQAVCVEMYGDLARIRKLESLRYWLATITTRQSLKWKRGRVKHQGEVVDLTAEADPLADGGPEWLAALERAQIMEEALAKLSERCRTLVRRLFYDDPPQPYDELARSLGLATGSIGFNRGRCLEKLRKELEELGL